MGPYILVIDQSTTTSRAFIFDAKHQIVATSRMDVTQHHPKPDWVEQVPEEIWATCLWACKAAIRQAGIDASEIAGIGIANQRATIIAWDRKTGRTIGNALVWRDQRTIAECDSLNHTGHGEMVSHKTGLLLHPYFSGSKITWMLDTIPGLRTRAEAGEIALGTVDSFLIHKLTGGKVHATDASNASQTILFNIETNEWDSELLALFQVPVAVLPEVKDSADNFGLSESSLFGAPIPILGVVGNQQAALIGHACFEPGMLKSTYDEHCFALLNTGSDIVRSKHRLLSTIAYRLDGEPTYALEGAIVSVGGALRWLQDDLELFESNEVERLAQSSDPTKPIYLVPAYVGAGGGWQEEDARGAVFGITAGIKRRDLARAALEAVGYQSHDLMETMRRDWGRNREISIRVDGTTSGSDFSMQFLADLAQATVDRSVMTDVTPLGAAWLAGWKAGIWKDAEGFAAQRASDRQFQPRMDIRLRDEKIAGWRDTVRRVRPDVEMTE